MQGVYLMGKQVKILWQPILSIYQSPHPTAMSDLSLLTLRERADITDKELSVETVLFIASVKKRVGNNVVDHDQIGLASFSCHCF